MPRIYDAAADLRERMEQLAGRTYVEPAAAGRTLAERQNYLIGQRNQLPTLPPAGNVALAQRQLQGSRRAGEPDDVYGGRLAARGFQPDEVSDFMSNQPFRPVPVKQSAVASAPQPQRQSQFSRGVYQRPQPQAGPITPGSARALGIQTPKDQEAIGRQFAATRAAARDREGSLAMLDAFHGVRKFEKQHYDRFAKLADHVNPNEMRLLLDQFDEGGKKGPSLSDIERFVVWPKNEAGEPMYPEDPKELTRLYEDARQRLEDFQRRGGTGSTAQAAPQQSWTQQDIESLAAQIAGEIRASGRQPTPKDIRDELARRGVRR